jgi:hypothetical protein
MVARLTGLQQNILEVLEGGPESTALIVDVLWDSPAARDGNRTLVEAALADLVVRGLVVADETGQRLRELSTGGSELDPEFRRTHLDNWWRLTSRGSALSHRRIAAWSAEFWLDAPADTAECEVTAFSDSIRSEPSVTHVSTPKLIKHNTVVRISVDSVMTPSSLSDAQECAIAIFENALRAYHDAGGRDTNDGSRGVGVRSMDQ